MLSKFVSKIHVQADKHVRHDHKCYVEVKQKNRTNEKKRKE